MTDTALLAEAKAISTATIHEAQSQFGALPSAIKPLWPELRLAAPAFTVDSPGRNNILIHRAIYEASPGDVLVVKVDDFYEAGYWGEIMGAAARARQLAGLVIDGCVRDAEQLQAMNFPVFCRGICIRGTAKNPGGQLNQNLIIGDVPIAPGDIIVGDRDGVVVIPQESLAQVVANSQQRDAKEAGILKQLAAGETTLDIYNLR